MIALPSMSLATGAASQAIAGLASRASSTLQGFESDLQAGNLSGAQSFLTALQQKLGPGNTTGTGHEVSTQISQVSQDLQSGNAVAAQADFSTLQQTLHGLQYHRGSSPANSTATGQAADPSVTSVLSSGVLQQGAYNAALNLSLPASLPSLSVMS